MSEGHLETALLYQAGELAREEVPAFERHLAACRECREQCGLAEEALAWGPALEMPPGAALLGRTLLLGEEPDTWLAGLLAWPQRLSLAAAAVALLLILAAPPNDKPLPPWQSGLSERIWRLEDKLPELRGRLKEYKVSRRPL